MKKLMVLMSVLLLLFIAACSEKDDNPNDTNVYGYKLEQFVTTAITNPLIDTAATATDDFRSLFAIEIVSADANQWSPRLSSNAGYDLAWPTFKDGYIVPNPSSGNRTYFPYADLPGAFKVTNTGLFRLYRKVDLLSAAKDSVMVELRGLQPHCMDNWSGAPEDAIKLSDLLATYSGYASVTLIAVDGYSRDYTPEQIADGYYLLSSEVTTFPTLNDSMTSGQKKFKKLAKLRVSSEATNVNHQYLLADKQHANLEVPVPTSFTSYEATIMELD